MVDLDQIRKNLNSRKYTMIGSGSGRLVFDLKNGYVAKVAKNKKGLAQNKAEYKIEAMSDCDMFAKITAISEDCKVLIMQKAEQIKSISVIWKYYNVKSNHELFRQSVFDDFGTKYRLLYGDLCRKSSWGIINNKPVIIDYGFTKDTRKYYTFM
ncbi:MAG: hypothetical protein K0R00_2836 [Herbinix sp.]|nr:hypothetical protein [Herbinix sp.]